VQAGVRAVLNFVPSACAPARGLPADVDLKIQIEGLAFHLSALKRPDPAGLRTGPPVLPSRLKGGETASTGVKKRPEHAEAHILVKLWNLRQLPTSSLLWLPNQT